MLIGERTSEAEDEDGGSGGCDEDDRQLFDALLASRGGAPKAGAADTDTKADFAMEE